MSADFRGKGASPTNHCWCQKTRVIAVSCGIKIFAVHCLVLSQYTHLTDGRTDRQTDRQNCDSNTVRCITCSRMVKIKNSWLDQYGTKPFKQKQFGTAGVEDRIRMPFGIVGRTGPGMRRVVGFWDRSTGRGTFEREFGACHCS